MIARIKRKELIVFNFKNDEFIILDGATGTLLQKSGLKLGELPEILNFTNEDLIRNVHHKYLKAGSNIICANTFGANKHKLQNSPFSVTEVIEKGILLAKTEAKAYNASVALDIGPIGELLEPSGVLSFENAYEIFKEMMVIGEKSGADLILIETMTDLYEVKAAVLAAKENTSLPVFVTMTFEQNGRTFQGVGIENMAITLEGLGVDAIGINCSLGPKEILPLMKELSKNTRLPLIAKPNAGLPNPQTGEYDIDSDEFAEIMSEYAKIGVTFLGGCCGTDDIFIEKLKEKVQKVTPIKRQFTPKTRVCSGTKVVTVDSVKVIGERINPTGKKRFQLALKENDMNYILKQASEQIDAGADILDVNVGVPGLDEVTLMSQVVKQIQSISSIPLQIDASKFETLESGLRAYNGKPILNSVNGEEANLHKILPLAKKYGALVVGLTIDEDGIPKTAEKRIEIAKKILNTALFYGINKEDILIDCLTLTVSAEQSQCFETLNAMKFIRGELGLNLVLGVSNISFGIPNRELINQTFLTLAMNYGLTLPIINPNIKPLMDTISAYNVLSSIDIDSVNFIERFSNLSEEIKPKNNSKLTIEDAISKGLNDDVFTITKELLQTKTPLEIVNNILIPTLDVIGQNFEKGDIFLPQLIRSANASCVAFEVIKTELANNNEQQILKEKIILATVKGDVHDIGKNIVKVILENYGYQIIDLGKDVPFEKIIDAAIKNDVKLIGLSALMTTTVESMRETIIEVKKTIKDVQIMVGGAVLTEEYAKKIGADFYAKDAKQSADIAKGVFNER